MLSNTLICRTKISHQYAAGLRRCLRFWQNKLLSLLLRWLALLEREICHFTSEQWLTSIFRQSTLISTLGRGKRQAVRTIRRGYFSVGDRPVQRTSQLLDRLVLHRLRCCGGVLQVSLQVLRPGNLVVTRYRVLWHLDCRGSAKNLLDLLKFIKVDLAFFWNRIRPIKLVELCDQLSRNALPLVLGLSSLSLWR